MGDTRKNLLIHNMFSPCLRPCSSFQSSFLSWWEHANILSIYSGFTFSKVFCRKSDDKKPRDRGWLGFSQLSVSTRLGK